MRNPIRLLIALLASSSASALLSHAAAQIATDGTAGAATVLTGPDYAIPHTLGTTSGANLFHSFDYFSVPTGGSATFTGPAFDNVISRVTGASPSSIDGLLRNSVPGSDFYFINPNGVTFGPGASVDVPGAFHLSTGQELRFANGDTFSAVNIGGSTFSIAAPEAFGFLGGSGDIVLDGSNLYFLSDGATTFSAADVVLGDAQVHFAGSLFVLAAVGSGDAEVDIATGEIAGVASGDLRLRNTRVEASNATGTGPIILVAGDIALDLSFVDTKIFGVGTGGDISLLASRQIVLGDQGIVFTRTFGDGAAGSIRFEAPRITIFAASGSSADSEGSGRAGDITLTADVLEVLGGADSAVTGFRSVARREGDAGNIIVNVAERFLLQRATLVTRTSAEGQAGDIIINAPHAEVIIDGLTPFSTTYAGLQSVAGRSSLTVGSPTGNGGDIWIDADRLVMRNSAHLNSKGIGETGVRAGNITIVANDIDLLDDVEIKASSESGDTGNIQIVMPTNGVLRMRNALIVTTRETGVGAGGAVAINSPGVVIFEGGEFESAFIAGPTNYDFAFETLVTGIEALGEIDGANISIVSDYLLRSMEQPHRVAVNGALVLDTLSGDPVAGAAALEAGFLNAGDVLANQCAAQRAGAASVLSFGDANAPASVWPSPLTAPAFYSTGLAPNSATASSASIGGMCARAPIAW